MKEKFKEIPKDRDTKITMELKTNLGKYEIVYQKWLWDGIKAESIIFFNEDIEFLSEEEVKDQVKLSPLLKDNSEITYKKSDIYTFINFNFKEI